MAGDGAASADCNAVGGLWGPTPALAWAGDGAASAATASAAASTANTASALQSQRNGLVPPGRRIPPAPACRAACGFLLLTPILPPFSQVLHPAAMQPAMRSGRMAVRVKNSYNRRAPGTVISSQREMASSEVTSIVLKNNVTLVDIVSTRMLGQYGFLATVFEVRVPSAQPCLIEDQPQSSLTTLVVAAGAAAAAAAIAVHVCACARRTCAMPCCARAALSRC